MCSKIGRKTKQERREAPMFQYVIEMHSHVEWCVYTDVTRSVDALLAGKASPVQLRRHLNGKMVVTNQETASQDSKQNLARSKVSASWIDDLLHASQGAPAS